MPVASDSSLKTVSLVLTKDQVRRMKALAVLQSSDLRRVSFSDIGREIVEAGLRSISHVSDMNFGTMTVEDEREAVAS